MSRWNERFQSNVLGAEWARLKRSAEDAFADGADSAEIGPELARLRKVVGFIDGALDGVDPELLPFGFYDLLNVQASHCASRIDAYSSSRGIDDVRAANHHADELLSLVRPHLVLDGSAANAFRKAAVGYGKTYEQMSAKAMDGFREAVSELISRKAHVERIIKKIEQQTVRMDDEEQRLLGEEGVLVVAGRKATDAEEKFREIKALHQKIFHDVDGEESVKSQIDSAFALVSQKAQEAATLVSTADQPIKKIVEYEGRLLGNPSRPDEESVSAFIERQKKKLTEFEVEQASKTEALIQKIESLIPGATSAGLATAYHEMKNSFDAPIKTASRIFYGTIAVLIFGSILLCVQKIYWFGIEFIPLPDWESSLRSFAYKLPFYGAAVWLAYYASKRRSEFQRLQQEYAHKEALAKSYDSFKRQIEALGSKDDVLMAMLLEKAIGAIAHNASQTLDGKHGDKSPSHDALDKVLGNLTGLKEFFQKP
jgi:hypothetical protein